MEDGANRENAQQQLIAGAILLPVVSLGSIVCLEAARLRKPSFRQRQSFGFITSVAHSEEGNPQGRLALSTRFRVVGMKHNADQLAGEVEPIYLRRQAGPDIQYWHRTSVNRRVFLISAD
jgi:hypothetical protein